METLYVIGNEESGYYVCETVTGDYQCKYRTLKHYMNTDGLINLMKNNPEWDYKVNLNYYDKRHLGKKIFLVQGGL